MPKPAEGTKRAAAGLDRNTTSRLARMKAMKQSIPLPPVPMPHVIARLMEIGLSEPAGMGMAPLSWTTIDVWQRVTGVALMPWEARLLRSLSASYVVEGRAAECETAPAPWRSPVTKQDQDAEDALLRSVLG